MITEPPSQDHNETGRLRFAEAFQDSLPIPSSVDPNLEEALRHVLDHPGSLIRPRLVAQLAAAFELEISRSRDLAVGLEYFHSASLLFDDLPCMDNASERRGIPCAHLVYGESGAILAALGLINRAYALTWRAVQGNDSLNQAQALSFVEQCLGVGGLLNGQSMDLRYSHLPHTLETTEKIARGKTVSLIRLTLVLPAMLGNASQRELQLLERIALHWGLAYQVLDDLKDLLQCPAATGKTAGRDIALDRPNTAFVLGTKAAIDRVERLIRAGGRAVRRLCASRGGLDFLEVLQQKLASELAQLTEAASGTKAGVKA